MYARAEPHCTYGILFVGIAFATPAQLVWCAPTALPTGTAAMGWRIQCLPSKVIVRANPWACPSQTAAIPTAPSQRTPSKFNRAKRPQLSAEQQQNASEVFDLFDMDGSGVCSGAAAAAEGHGDPVQR